MAVKLIKLENEYYLTTEAKVEKGDYGLAFAHGVRNGFGRGWYIFYHDGRPVNKLNAICAGTRKITHSTAPIDGDEVGSSFHIIEQLSLKNCEAIANGYDLYELADEFSRKFPNDSEPIRYASFIIGFQKALEILGDKKFSDNDIENAIEMCIKLMNDKGSEFREHKQTVIQSLQQTEWDVEIVKEPYHDGNFVNDGNTHSFEPKWREALDEKNCIILKRI